VNYATERVSERCQIKAKRQQRAKQGTTIEPLRGIFRTCLNLACYTFEHITVYYTNKAITNIHYMLTNILSAE